MWQIMKRIMAMGLAWAILGCEDYPSEMAEELETYPTLEIMCLVEVRLQVWDGDRAREYGELNTSLDLGDRQLYPVAIYAASRVAVYRWTDTPGAHAIRPRRPASAGGAYIAPVTTLYLDREQCRVARYIYELAIEE